MAITVEKVVKQELKKNKNNSYKNAVKETAKASVGNMPKKSIIKKVAIFGGIALGLWWITTKFLTSKSPSGTGNDLPNFN